MRPLLDREWFAPVVAPMIVGAVLLGIWQFCCGYFEIPIYLFPAPSDIAESLVENWPQLAARFGQHVEDHLRSVRFGNDSRRADGIPVHSKPLDRNEPAALCSVVAGHPDRRGGAADHHLGEEHAPGADRVRHGDRAVPDHQQYDDRATQRRSGPSCLLPHEQGRSGADAMAAAGTKRPAVLHGRAADFQRVGFDRRGGGGIRRRHRRSQCRAWRTRFCSRASSWISPACSPRCC